MNSPVTEWSDTNTLPVSWLMGGPPAKHIPGVGKMIEGRATMPKRDKTGPPSGSGGPRDGRGGGKGRARGKGVGARKGGRKG